MMEIYVLIMLAVGTSNGGSSSTVAEFTTKERCENAGKDISDAVSRGSIDRTKHYVWFYYICVQK